MRMRGEKQSVTTEARHDGGMIMMFRCVSLIQGPAGQWTHARQDDRSSSPWLLHASLVPLLVLLPVDSCW
jgi:hypothetical protein